MLQGRRAAACTAPGCCGALRCRGHGRSRNLLASVKFAPAEAKEAAQPRQHAGQAQPRPLHQILDVGMKPLTMWLHRVTFKKLQPTLQRHMQPNSCRFSLDPSQVGSGSVSETLVSVCPSAAWIALFSCWEALHWSYQVRYMCPEILVDDSYTKL